ncbi:DUF4142 domain-containing protein [Streptomyces sp. CB00455]|uniref:DUF4142 domain-containing protein n=1 Tax=Streptomyces sp. CB00455 TaxID=1703927 RepID=UPI0009A1350A|nr:DUF4142 domain-containing protein [Streptomyces sp. CB00455]
MRARVLAIAVFTASLGCSGVSAVAAAPAPDSADARFVQMAHQSNLAEIAAGHDTQTNAKTTCVKEVGAALVRDHTKLDAELSQLAEKSDVSLPKTPTREQQATLADVRSKAGSAAYDKAWLVAQEAGHIKTLMLIDQQISQGKDAETVTAAKEARPVVAMHLDMVRGGTCHTTT